MNLRTLGAVAVAVVWSSGANAAETRTITVENAVASALDRNFSIRIEALSPIIARARIEAELGAFDPNLEASYSLGKNRDLTRFRPPKGGNEGSRSGRDEHHNVLVAEELHTQRWATGITGLLPWGTTYDLGWDVEHKTGFFNDFDDQYNSFLGLTLTQPLLQGAGSEVNTTGIRIARKDAVFSDWQFRSQVITTITDALFTYYDLYASNIAQGVAQDSNNLAAQLLADNVRRAEIGVMSPLDITTARAELAQRADRLLLAERIVRDNENLLKRVISDDVLAEIDDPFSVVRPPLVPSHFNLDRALKEAFQLRPDYRQAILQFEKNQIQLAFEKNQELPRLDVTTSLGLNGVDPEIGESLHQSLNAKNYAWKIGAVFQLPIPNRTARSNRRIAELELARSFLGLRQLEQEIIIAVDNAMGQVFTSRQRIEASEQARILAEESLAAEEEKLRAGTSTTFVVLELQRNLAEARLSEIQSRTDYNKSVAALDRETGTTLDRWNVTLEAVNGAPVVVRSVRGRQ